MSKTLRISPRTRDFCQDCVITGHLTFQVQLPLNPPNRRVKKENSFKNFLYQVRPIVMAAKMREFAQSCFMAMGTEPELLATVVTGPEAAQIIPEAVRNAKKTPVL